MRQDLDRPADTSMMGIVHDALRRDLARARRVLTTPPYPTPPQRDALGRHLGWMMDFLHAHHEGEDAGLYPMVRAADPSAGSLLDAMAADHDTIDPAVKGFAEAADRWRRTGSDEDRDALVAALDVLCEVLLPHLDREETQAMPLVSASITHRQWHDWDQTHNIKPKSMPVLAEEGNWLLDDLDDRRRQIVLHEVPLVPRYIVLWGFGPGYRRRASARWAR